MHTNFKKLLDKSYYSQELEAFQINVYYLVGKLNITTLIGENFTLKLFCA